MINKIELKGAREHNLKNVSLKLPKNKLIVFTGLSGSGKTSLAIDTIHAEGQRRYLESLSLYSRQFLGGMKKPDVDEIKGLPVSVAITQKNTTTNPRSIVATATEIYDYLRVLFSRVGDVVSPFTGKIIKSYSPTEITDIILNKPSGSKIQILAPVDFSRYNNDFERLIETLLKNGFRRIRINKETQEIEHAKAPQKIESIELIVDRIISSRTDRARIINSIELALKISHSIVWIMDISTNEIEKYSTKFMCPESGFYLDDKEPGVFSFNNPKGACKACKGLGEQSFFAEEYIVPNEELSIFDGAINPGFKFSRTQYQQVFKEICKFFKSSFTIPFKNLPKEAQKAIFYGIDNGYLEFQGVIPELIQMYNRSESDFLRGVLNKYKKIISCPECKGARLKDEILCVKIEGFSIYDVIKLSVDQAIEWIDTVSNNLSRNNKTIAKNLLQEIFKRLNFLKSVGLDYLTLNRKSATLSGGEMQRITLASQLGSGLTGVLFVLDEPSVGLHPRDTKRLVTVLKDLQNNGNTIIVIEHEELIIKSADYFVDVGPEAGKNGGQIVLSGNLEQFKNAKNSLTSDYIFGRKKLQRKTEIRNAKHFLTIKGVQTNNLKNIDVYIPLNVFCAITGVSGSGKSSLIIDTLIPALMKKNLNENVIFKKILGAEEIERVIEIDQAPIGRTPRSNPITYTDGFSNIRELFAMLPESKSRGYSAGRFSFNVKGGRCEACEGAGYMVVSMHFLPDVLVECEHCKGKRYNKDTLDILYNEKSIADVLDMTVDEAYEFFKNVPKVSSKLEFLKKVGLGYIKLGQPATSLSGGEAQRIKLAKELSKKSNGNILYVLDEPTTGLHFEDIRKLLEVLHALVDKGNSVIVIEHNMDVIKSSDFVIDLGVFGGEKGGKIAALGPPVDLINKNPKASIYGIL